MRIDRYPGDEPYIHTDGKPYAKASIRVLLNGRELRDRKIAAFDIEAGYVEVYLMEGRKFVKDYRAERVKTERLLGAVSVQVRNKKGEWE